MCCRSRLTPVLFAGKEGKLRSKAAIVGDRKDPAQTQTALADLLRGLFRSSTGSWTPPSHRQQDLQPRPYPRLPLLSFDCRTSDLNQVFWLVYDDAAVAEHVILSSPDTSLAGDVFKSLHVLHLPNSELANAVRLRSDA